MFNSIMFVGDDHGNFLLGKKAFACIQKERVLHYRSLEKGCGFPNDALCIHENKGGNVILSSYHPLIFLSKLPIILYPFPYPFLQELISILCLLDFSFHLYQFVLFYITSQLIFFAY